MTRGVAPLNGSSAIAARRMAGRIGARVLILILTLSAFVGQSVFTQTHLHDTSVRTASHVLADHVPLVREHPAQRDLPIDCPICREMALSGHYIAPTPIEFAPPAALALWLAIALILPGTLPSRSHAWRSRAPPHHS